ncbi:MAG: PBSX family phage terminase large subunit [Eubacterium sp.]
MVLNWWMNDSYSRKNGIIADGAIRSGKTVCMSLSFVMWAMERFNNENFALCGKTIGSLRRNVLMVLKLMLKGRGYGITDHRADNLLVVTRGNRTNYFYLFGGKDERSQDLIQGITLAGAFFDEVALMPESFVNQATARCSVEGSKWWFNCNPEGPNHFFKKEWIDKRQQKNLIYLHFTMDDNLSLSDEIKQRYRGMYSGVFFKRYILGMWVAAEGLIYDMFDEKRHVVPAFRAVPSGRMYVSCDYGTQNPTVFLLWAKVDGKWTVIREYYYDGRNSKRQKTDSEYAEDLRMWLGSISPISIVVDPSAASFIAELRKHGFTVKKAKNDVLDGIRYVATLLNEDEIAFSDGCTNLIREFRSYVWDEKAVERGEDKPIKQFDHAMDAMRYFCYTIVRKGSGSVSILR